MAKADSFKVYKNFPSIDEIATVILTVGSEGESSFSEKFIFLYDDLLSNPYFFSGTTRVNFNVQEHSHLMSEDDLFKTDLMSAEHLIYQHVKSKKSSLDIEKTDFLKLNLVADSKNDDAVMSDAVMSLIINDLFRNQLEKIKKTTLSRELKVFLNKVLKFHISAKYPLRGNLIHYDNPTDPVDTSDWEATK